MTTAQLIEACKVLMEAVEQYTNQHDSNCDIPYADCDCDTPSVARQALSRAQKIVGGE